MWQPPGGLSGPPELIPVQELGSPQDTLDINPATRVTRTRKRLTSSLAGGRRIPGLRQTNTTAQNNHSQNGTTWIFRNRRCPDDSSRRHFRMANLYDVQYSPNNILNSIPDGVISNENEPEDRTHRCLTKREHPELDSNRRINEQSNENLTLWPLKQNRFSSYDDDFNMISSYPSTQLLSTEISQCSTSDVITEAEIPNMFNTRLDNMSSISDYSAIITNNPISFSNPSTSIASYTTLEPVGEPISTSILENSDTSSVSSEMSDLELKSVNLYCTERSIGKRLTSSKQNEIVLLELHKLHGFSNINLPSPTVQARRVANKIINHARIYKIPDERAIWCINCDRIPTSPITGQCGHTRCSKCIKENDACPCGAPSPRSPCVNTVIQEIIDKMLQYEPGSARSRVLGKSGAVRTDTYHRKNSTSSPSVTVTPRRIRPCPRVRRSTNSFNFSKNSALMAGTPESRLPMSPQGRLKRARELLGRGRWRDAVPLLARVAASAAPLARLARTLLAQAISALSQSLDPRRLTRELYRAIRQQSAVSWLKPSDLECVLCYHTYTSPVTTPCGHTYCRTCIERSMDYRKTCALCLRPLGDFNLAATRETEFVNAALAAIDAVSSPPPPDPDVIPIFVCTVAFPSIPCPLFIFDPRYWMMIRRILESGSRKFGMVAYERDRSYSDYGTVLEVCDCVHLEDGRSILSTVGVSRFRVIERDVHDGCDVARIQPLIDVTPTEDVVWELRVMATQISYKALVWLDGMNRAVRAEIEAAFGPMPQFDHSEDDWWERADGPRWLWWLIAILPLRSEIKILILSTRSLLKRMMAVTRTLEVMDSEAFINNSNNECDIGTALSSTEEWLERNA